MIEPALYFGGMILSSMESALQYEEALVKFINRRSRMFEGDTFWARNRLLLMDFESIAKFPDDAYHYVPSDPLVVIPDYHRVMLLKRKYLNRLRQRALKYHRGGGKPKTVSQWQYQEDFAQEWIDLTRKRKGLPPEEKDEP